VAGRFPLYTDADVHGPVVKALQSAEWDVLRGIAAYPEKTRDDIHFARAAKEQRVLVSNDLDMKMLAETWFLEGRIYRGLVWWPRSHYSKMGPGDFVAAFEDLAVRDDPFAGYPIVHIKPKH
jgi:hypothetical protein